MIVSQEKTSRALSVLSALTLTLMLVAGATWSSDWSPSQVDASASEQALAAEIGETRRVLSEPPPTTTTIAPTTTTRPPSPPTTAKRAGRSAGGGARSAPTPPKDVWGALGACESGNNPTAHSSTGKYHGAFQFSIATWQGLGYAGDPHNYSYAVQLEAAKKLQARSGWGQWPSCARQLGLI